MPFINTKTTVTIDKEKKDILTAAIGQITQECLGKTENWLMTGYEDNADLYFQGKQDQAAAYVEVKLYGNSSADAYSQMTTKMCDLYEKELGISADHLYITYYPTTNWGWNRINF